MQRSLKSTNIIVPLANRAQPPYRFQCSELRHQLVPHLKADNGWRGRVIAPDAMLAHFKLVQAAPLFHLLSR